jgi:hypothetical protein
MPNKRNDHQQLSATENERRQKAWREFDALLARVHARTQNFSVEEIEADITAARQEVRDLHRTSRHHV